MQSTLEGPGSWLQVLPNKAAQHTMLLLLSCALFDGIAVCPSRALLDGLILPFLAQAAAAIDDMQRRNGAPPQRRV